MRDWGHVSEAYERSFARLCAGTIPRLLTDAAGPRVLDVGCGSGELAERAEGKGRAVTAVDADPAMAARTRERIVGEVLEAALPHLPLPGDAFDSVVANFVINHVARPADAVAELARLVRPGGSAAMTIWPSGGAAWQDLVAECFDAADFAPVPSERLPPALDFERTGAGLAVLASGQDWCLASSRICGGSGIRHPQTSGPASGRASVAPEPPISRRTCGRERRPTPSSGPGPRLMIVCGSSRGPRMSWPRSRARRRSSVVDMRNDPGVATDPGSGGAPEGLRPLDGSILQAVREASESARHPIVVGISGYCGAVKSVLARQLEQALPGAVRVRGDDFLDPERSHRRSTDWDGVERQRLRETVLLPFRHGRRGTFRRFDWSTRALGPPEPVPAGRILLVDLIGLLHPGILDALDLSIWCDADLETAAARGMERDSRLGRDHERLWRGVWMPNDRDFDRAFCPREAAALILDAR
jgi:SAM-dependent methyltransferase